MRVVKTDIQGRVQVFPIKAATLTRGGVGNLTATFVATRNHRLTTGQRAKVIGSNLIPFNGEFVITVTSATAFTYVMAVDPGADATVTNVLAQGLLEASEYAPFIAVGRGNGAMKVDAGPDSYYATSDPENDVTVTPVAARLFSVHVRNTSGGDLYLFVHDSAGAAAGSSTPTLPAFTVPSGGVWGYDFPGLPFVNGIYVALSSSAASLALATDVGHFFVSYRDVM